MAKAFLEAVQQLPDFLRLNLSRIPPDAAKRTTEIRLRSDRPVLLTAGGTNQFVLQGGNLALQQNASALTLSHEQLKKCFLPSVSILSTVMRGRLHRAFLQFQADIA